MLINNAGVGIVGPMASVPLADVRRSFEVNVFGMVALSQAVIPGMRERGWGRIINVSSVAGILASPLGSPYSMTKHAVEAFTKSLRAELAPHGIDVTKVNPGPYDTGFNDRMVNGAADFIEDGDTKTTEIHAVVRQIILTDQLDPAEVSNALADLVEADETPGGDLPPRGHPGAPRRLPLSWLLAAGRRPTVGRACGTSWRPCSSTAAPDLDDQLPPRPHPSTGCRPSSAAERGRREPGTSQVAPGPPTGGVGDRPHRYLGGEAHRAPPRMGRTGAVGPAPCNPCDDGSMSRRAALPVGERVC